MSTKRLDPPSRGIGFHLTALILLAVIPLLLITSALIWWQSERQREAVEQSLLQTAVALSVAVDRQLDNYRIMLETLAESQALRDRDLARFQAYCRRAADRNGALFVSLFDSNGKQLFNTLTRPGQPLPTPYKDPRVRLDDPDKPPVGDPTFLKQVFQSGEPAYSDLTYGLVAGRLIFLVNVPVLDEGRVAYVINAAFEPEVMTRLLRENRTFSGVPAVIFDRKGFIAGRWQQAEKYVGTRIAGYDRIRQATTGAGQGETLEGIKVYFSWARSARTGWGVNVGRDRAAVERGVYKIWAIGAGLAAAGLALGVTLALVLASRLRRSIALLADSAMRRLPPRLKGLRTREISQLERALDESAAAIEAQARERESRLVAEAHRAEAERANQMKDRFIALLSHELRNPLAPIRTSVHLLRELQKRPGARVPEIVDMLDRQSQQLTRLVNDLLDVSRINAGRMSLRSERIDLCAVARHAIETAGPAIQQRSHSLQASIPADPVEVVGDSARLSQVLSNLLDNAAKFTSPGGTISVEVKRQDGSAIARVTDTGRGMDADLLRELFTPFAQSEKLARHSSETGLGLGLALGKSIAELHGGTLEAASKGAGKGSEFTLRLPLASAPEGAARASQPDPVSFPGRVLIADDNVDAAFSMSALLRSKDCETRVVHDGEECLRAAAEWHPDVVLLDIGMPGMDGYEVARRLRADRPVAPLIVALTGWSQDADKERSRGAAFDLHLVKPVELDDLQRAMNLLWDRRGAGRQSGPGSP